MSDSLRYLSEGNRTNGFGSSICSLCPILYRRAIVGIIIQLESKERDDELFSNVYRTLPKTTASGIGYIIWCISINTNSSLSITSSPPSFSYICLPFSLPSSIYSFSFSRSQSQGCPALSRRGRSPCLDPVRLVSVGM